MKRTKINDRNDILEFTTEDVLNGELMNLMSLFNKSKEEIQSEWSILKTQNFEHWQNRDYGDYGNTKFIYSSNLYINKNNDIIAIGDESASRYVYDYLSTEMFRNLVDREKFREEYETLIECSPFKDLVSSYKWYDNLYIKKGFWDYLLPKSEFSIEGYGSNVYLLIRNPLKNIDPETYIISGCNRRLTMPGSNECGLANIKLLEG